MTKTLDSKIPSTATSTAPPERKMSSTTVNMAPDEQKIQPRTSNAAPETRKRHASMSEILKPEPANEKRQCSGAITTSDEGEEKGTKTNEKPTTKATTDTDDDEFSQLEQFLANHPNRLMTTIKGIYTPNLHACIDYRTNIPNAILELRTFILNNDTTNPDVRSGVKIQARVLWYRDDTWTGTNYLRIFLGEQKTSATFENQVKVRSSITTQTHINTNSCMAHSSYNKCKPATKHKQTSE
jgi:hypothetical protein